MAKWKVLIVTDGRINPQYYQNDKFFSKENWSFFNVGKGKITSDEYDVINSSDIEGYEYLGKDWAESEVIYNVTKLGLFKEYDFLGLIHWDFNLHCKSFDSYRITENITRMLDSKNSDWISFFPAAFKSITGMYDVMLDERKPNCLFCRDSGLENPRSVNSYLCSIIGNPDLIKSHQFHIISLCCAFITTRDKFCDIGRLIYSIKESKILDSFDTEKRHRFPGQVMERLVALYSMHQGTQHLLDLDHDFIGGHELNAKDPNGENY